MKLQIFIPFVVLVFAMQKTAAQYYSIKGHVQDAKTFTYLPEIDVYLTDLKLGVSSDTKGDFKIEHIQSGTYLIEVSALGYNTATKKINLQGDTFLNVSLYPTVSELNEVIITAVTRSTALNQSPIIMKSLDRNTMNQQSANNLIDALKNVAGINQISTGIAISKPIIRGLGYNRVISLYNGIRQEGQQWGDEHGIEIDEYNVDRIEIVKGPGSLMYGSDGIAGVINFLSPKVPHVGKIQTQLSTNFQSNNQFVGYSLSNAGNKKGLQWLGRLTQKNASNYKNKYDQKVFNSGFKEFDGSLFLGINKNWGHTHFNFSSFNTTLNLVEGERDSNGKFIMLLPDGSQKTTDAYNLKGYKIGFPHQYIQHNRLSTNNYFVFKKGTLHVDFALQNNKRKEYGDVMNPKDVALFFDLVTFNYQLRYNFAETKGWETSFGMGGMQQLNTNKGSEFLIPAYKLFDVGMFLFTQKTFHNKLTLAGGIRLDNRTMNVKKLSLDSLGIPTTIEDTTTIKKFGSLSKNYQGISGSVGLCYQLNKNSTLKLNISRGFRVASIAELASNGRHEGTFRYEIGNQNLKSEISHQIDLAFFHNAEHLTIELTPFANFISNYIFTKKLKDLAGNDIIIDPSDPAPAFQFTQGEAILFGAEINLDIHPHPLDWLHIEQAFSFVNATQQNATDSTKHLPFTPSPKYRGELKAQFKKLNTLLTNAYLKFAFEYTFTQSKIFSAYNTESMTPAYSLLSCGIGSNIKAFHRKDFINLYFSIENLANVGYQSHLSRLKYAPENRMTKRNGVFNAGRNASMKLIFNF
jgi:iron complex outermembrane recepter protein